MDNDYRKMISEGKSCHISQDETGTVLKVRPSMILNHLVNKISEQDIETAKTLDNRKQEINAIQRNLYYQCNETQCPGRLNGYRSVPYGNVNADVMFINFAPSEYETCMMSTHSDKDGLLLSLILNKMNISMDSVYCTDMVKCTNCSLVSGCMKTFLEKEIQLVNPKIIVCNGIETLQKLMLPGLPSTLAYGNIYIAENGIKATAIYNLSTVLEKEGEELNRAKTQLWKQLLNIFQNL